MKGGEWREEEGVTRETYGATDAVVPERVVALIARVDLLGHGRHHDVALGSGADPQC